jgi:hypothetical protein
MCKLVAGLIAICIVSPVLSAESPPDAVELRNRYIEFRGGEANLMAMQVVERDGTMNFFASGAPESGSYRTCIEYPSKVAVALDLPRTSMFERWTKDDGAQYCERNFSDCKPASPEKVEELKATALNANREILYYDTDWSKAIVTVDSPNVAKVTIGDAYYRIEIASGRLLEQGYTESGRRREYGDWHGVGDLMFPFYFADYVQGKLQYSAQLSAVIESPTLTPWCAKSLQ